MPSPILPADWDPVAAANAAMVGLINICEPRVKGAHDSDFVVIDGKAYVVHMANDEQPGEDPNWPYVYCVLTIADCATLAVEATLLLAASEMAFDNETLPVGSCFVPRPLRISDTTIRCFFASESPGKRQSQTWYRDFDVATRTFSSTIHRAKLTTAAGTFDMQPHVFHADGVAHGFTRDAKDYGLYPIDGFTVIDSRVHCVLNTFPGGQTALAALNDDADTFEVLGHFMSEGGGAFTEAAVNRLPDGTWLAIARQSGKDTSYGFAESSDGRAWSPLTPRDFAPNGGSSKPTLNCFDGIYHLGWQDAATVDGAFRSVFNIDVSRDGERWERKYRFETDRSFQYPTFRQGDDGVFVSLTQGDHSDSRKEWISFGKLE